MSTLFYNGVVSNFVKYPIFGCPKNWKILIELIIFGNSTKNKKPFPGNDVSCGKNVKYTMWVDKIGTNGPKRLKKCLFARYCTLNMPSYIENTIFL